MSFTWKPYGQIFKGEGIFHLTFAVCDRKKMNHFLGEIVGPDKVRLTPYGKAVDEMLRTYDETHPGITVCARKVLDDHFHVVLWVKKPPLSANKQKPLSILQIAYGMRVQLTHTAQEMGVWPKATRAKGATHAEKGIGHVFDEQFVRTLARQGQLRAMVAYVSLNPYRKWTKMQHPELFTMHKETEVMGLRFRSMGNHWLLDWPMRQMVTCSRSETQTDWKMKLEQVMRNAEAGVVTYTAAISQGEQFIARHVREAGRPLVVLMKGGFPAEGSNQERYYKPGGVYFDACAQGKLLLLEANIVTYADARIVAATEAVLKQKAAERHQHYVELPHDGLRWRFIAGNEIIRMMTEHPGEEGERD